MLSRSFRLGCALVFTVVLAGGVAPATVSGQAAPAPQKAAQDAALPDAKAVLDRHIEAVGGRQALAARSSVRTAGTISIPANGMSGKIEILSARPNKMLVKTTLDGIGEVMEGFDGTHAWSINPMTGPMLASGEELAQRALDADFDSIMNVSSRYTSYKTLEKTTFDGRDCYKVALTRKDGVEDIDFYDVASGLKAGSINSRKNPMGTITVTSMLQDYKKFGDLLQPTVVKQSVEGAQIITTITAVEYDKVDPSAFDLPAQIKALIK